MEQNCLHIRVNHLLILLCVVVLLVALQYMCHTSPDINFTANQLIQYLSTPLDTHWVACKRIRQYLKGTIPFALHFCLSPQPLSLQAYRHFDWVGNLDDKKSTTCGYVVLWANLIFWSSKKQTTVSHSSTEAEYRELAHISIKVIWLHSLLRELGFSLHHT